MIQAKDFYDALKENEIDFFTGVPDSLLKDFCAYVTDNAAKEKNIITANEGNAIGLAAGHYLATGKAGVVYMQNSGLGNTVNPITSLMDQDVYSIPALLIIGWRAEPGQKDEPQHVKMGKITEEMLDTMGIPHKVLDDNYQETIKEAVSHMKEKKAPYAIIVKKGTFEKYSLQNKKENGFSLNREEAVKHVVPLLEKDAIVVSTTGKTSRELFELREQLNQGHEKDFLTVGSMGHSSSIALGIALEKSDRSVYCFDGDGALLMHMGALATVSQLAPKNFKHIVFNNMAHDSVGGQPTAADLIDICGIVQASGYQWTMSVKTSDEIEEGMTKLSEAIGPALLEIKVNTGARKDLGRPTRTPIENKEDFMAYLQ